MNSSRREPHHYIYYSATLGIFCVSRVSRRGLFRNRRAHRKIAYLAAVVDKWLTNSLFHVKKKKSRMSDYAARISNV